MNQSIKVSVDRMRQNSMSQPCSSFMFNKRLNIHQFYSVNEPLWLRLSWEFQKSRSTLWLRCFACSWFIHNMLGFSFFLSIHVWKRRKRNKVQNGIITWEFFFYRKLKANLAFSDMTLHKMEQQTSDELDEWSIAEELIG